MEIRDSHGSWPVRETPTVDLVGGAAARARQNLIGGVCRVVAWLPHGESVAFGASLRLAFGSFVYRSDQ